MQSLRLIIAEDGLLNSEEHLESIKKLVNTILKANDTSIEIVDVSKGSIIIEAKVRFCKGDSTLLLATVKEILLHVMQICKIPQETKFVLRVGLKVGPLFECLTKKG